MSNLNDLAALLADDDAGDPPAATGKPDGKGLRAQLQALLEQNRVLAERAEKAEAAQRGRDLNDLFGKHSIPELARDFFPKDAELTDEVATSFVEKYGQLWGAKSAEATTPPPAQQATSVMQQLAANAGSAEIEPLSEDHYRAQFAGANTRAELEQLIGQANALGRSL